MGILIKPLLCIDHNYVFFLMLLHVFTNKLNLRFYSFVKHVKHIKPIIKHDKYATFHLTRYRKSDI